MSAIKINVDSIEVVNGLNSCNYGNPIGRALIKKIRSFLAFEWEIVVGHVYREENQCADALARNGIVLSEDMCFYDTCPPHIKHLLDADLLGNLVSHVVSI